MNAVDEAHQRVERLTEQLRQATTWRMAPVVEALQALRGVSLVAGASILAELGDLTRFDDPRQLMAFVGLVPSQYSSGPHQRMGGITKTGNSHARRMLVEAAWAYRFPRGWARGLCEGRKACRRRPSTSHGICAAAAVQEVPPLVVEGQDQAGDHDGDRARARWIHLGDRRRSAAD